jgi:hypothetical protein
MKLQRYEPHMYGSLLGESRILFEASDTGEWVKADEAIALEKENKALFENNKELYAAGLALKKLNDRLQDHILKDSCPWCGLNSKSNVKRQATEAT